MSRTEASTLCAEVIVDELVALGVREVVVAPGSRSAPLALAAWRAAERGSLRLHVRIDERTAGFLALGLGKASRVPAVVLTTSGTAPAHLYPAVLEARHAYVPMIVVTADRPATMIDIGANQTTTQVGMYAGHVAAEARIAAVDEAPDAWRTVLRRLVTASAGVRSGRAGPVHLNVELIEPLTPVEVAVPPRGAFTVPGSARTPTETTELGADRRTVVVAGDAPVEVGAAAVAFAEHADVPLLAEPSSNARRGDQAIGCYRLLLESALAREIERVVVFGHPTLSRPVQRLLGRADVELVVVTASPEWIDPGHAANLVVSAVRQPPAGSDWVEQWRGADRAARRTVDTVLGPELSGWRIAEQVWAATAADGVLVAGSSQAIRDLDLAPVSSTAARVHANRGLSGIDGTVSTAAGIGLALARPVTALMGDLTFLHDLNGLLIGPAEACPDLRVVVVNDDGGAIFSTLEQGAPEHAAAFERVFGTPHGSDLAALVAGLAHRHHRVRDTDELAAALARPVCGIEVVECVVARTDRRRVDAELRRSAAARR